LNYETVKSVCSQVSFSERSTEIPLHVDWICFDTDNVVVE